MAHLSSPPPTNLSTLLPQLIEQLERAAGRQRHYSKALLAFLGLCVAVLYLFFAAYQLLWPWQTPHQARFAGHLRPLAVVAADLGGAATVLLAVLAALSYPGHQARANCRALLSAAAFTALLLSLFWSVAIARVSFAHEIPLVRRLGAGRSKQACGWQMACCACHCCGVSTCQSWQAWWLAPQPPAHLRRPKPHIPLDAGGPVAHALPAHRATLVCAAASPCHQGDAVHGSEPGHAAGRPLRLQARVRVQRGCPAAHLH